MGTYICPIALFWDRTLFFTILFWFDLAILVCILHRADGRSCPRSRLSLITRPWGTSPANNEPQKKMPRKSWWPSINDFPLSCTGQFFKSLDRLRKSSDIRGNQSCRVPYTRKETNDPSVFEVNSNHDEVDNCVLTLQIDTQTTPVLFPLLRSHWNQNALLCTLYNGINNKTVCEFLLTLIKQSAPKNRSCEEHHDWDQR